MSSSLHERKKTCLFLIVFFFVEGFILGILRTKKTFNQKCEIKLV